MNVDPLNYKQNIAEYYGLKTDFGTGFGNFKIYASRGQFEISYEVKHVMPEEKFLEIIHGGAHE